MLGMWWAAHCKHRVLHQPSRVRRVGGAPPHHPPSPTTSRISLLSSLTARLSPAVLTHDLRLLARLALLTLQKSSILSMLGYFLIHEKQLEVIWLDGIDLLKLEILPGFSQRFPFHSVDINMISPGARLPVRYQPPTFMRWKCLFLKNLNISARLAPCKTGWVVVVVVTTQCESCLQNRNWGWLYIVQVVWC